MQIRLNALEKCEFVVVSDICLDTDTTQYADVLLPALGWGEKDGTVTNSGAAVFPGKRLFCRLRVKPKQTGGLFPGWLKL